jgi:hypothetical protein
LAFRGFSRVHPDRLRIILPMPDASRSAGPPAVVFDTGMPGIGRQQAGGCPAVSSCGRVSAPRSTH